MGVYTIKKYGNGLHIVLSKKAYKEGQIVELAGLIEKQATVEPKEQIKQQKTPLMSNDICPYYLESTSGCKVSIPVGQYVECAGSLLKCPKKA